VHQKRDGEADRPAVQIVPASAAVEILGRVLASGNLQLLCIALIRLAGRQATPPRTSIYFLRRFALAMTRR